MKKPLAASLIFILTLVFSLIFFPAQTVIAETIIYVDDDAPNDPGPGNSSVSDPLEDGSSTHPFDEIQEGIDKAGMGFIVQVLPGVYYENLILKDGVQLSGSGAEVTTINGSASGRVVLAIDVGNGAKIDGFTITNGRVDPVIGGDGAGLAIYGASSELLISNNIIIGNHAVSSGHQGGGMFIGPEAAPIVSNNIIEGNSSEASLGGGINIMGGSGRIENNIISNNWAGSGGGILSHTSDCIIEGNIIVGNFAGTDGGGILTWSRDTTVINISININCLR